ncbi:mucin-19-like [Amia ocellicauda]|uniref:mucin-19-like n=1 Tax=Amia ocellicauda TaxID=2972642 RepID=UPI0034638C2F
MIKLARLIFVGVLFLLTAVCKTFGSGIIRTFSDTVKYVQTTCPIIFSKGSNYEIKIQRGSDGLLEKVRIYVNDILIVLQNGNITVSNTKVTLPYDHQHVHIHQYGIYTQLKGRNVKLQCTNGKWDCDEKQCSSTCSIEGGMFITTFDGKLYSLPGKCKYVVAQKTYKFSKEDINLDNKVLNEFYQSDYVTVFWQSSMYIQVVTSFGLKMQIQTYPLIQVYLTLPPEKKGTTKGLCGNFNDDITDEFTTSSGIIETLAKSFAISWKMGDSLPNGEGFPRTSVVTRSKRHSVKADIGSCSRMMETLLQTDYEAAAQVAHLHNTESLQALYLAQLAEPPDTATGLVWMRVRDLLQCAALCVKIAALLEKQTGGILFHLVPKKDGGFRPILDLRRLNRHLKVLCLKVLRFKMLTLWTMSQAIMLGDWFTTVDLKDAYFHIPIKYMQKKSVIPSETLMANLRHAMTVSVPTCPNNQKFDYNMNACNHTCRSLSEYDVTCDVKHAPVDGCGCPEGTHMNSDGACTTKAKCCTEVGKIFIHCSNSSVSTRRRTCESLNKPELYSENCKSGCYCPEGRYENHNRLCVPQEHCTCTFGGEVYESGQTVINNCQDCTCTNGIWICSGKLCPGKCQVYGDGHYQTFDLNWFRYDGNCAYTLVEDDCGDGNGSFHIRSESVPCCDEALTCSRAIVVDLVDKVTLTLDDMTVKVNPQNVTCEAEPMYSVHTVGLYIIISLPEQGITLIWDKHTRVTIFLDAMWKNKVCGLCGNFDSNAKNDLQTRAMSSVTNVLEFGNSWKTPGARCSDTVNQIFPCEKYSYCSTWAVRRCQIILSPTFESCHAKVEVSPYYDACVEESCSCEMEGRFLGFCTAVAAYAEACSEKGVCIKWRTPDLCPVYCDYYNEQDKCSWHYDPCGSIQTCGRNNKFSGKLEGCYPRCPTETPYFDENSGKCSALGNCSCLYNELVLKAGDSLSICGNKW